MRLRFRQGACGGAHAAAGLSPRRVKQAGDAPASSPAAPASQALPQALASHLWLYGLEDESAVSLPSKPGEVYKEDWRGWPAALP